MKKKKIGERSTNHEIQGKFELNISFRILCYETKFQVKLNGYNKFNNKAIFSNFYKKRFGVTDIYNIIYKTIKFLKINLKSYFC